MNVKHIELPYNMDVTFTTNAVNLLVEKLIELAKEYMVVLPSEVRPYSRVDLAEIADALRQVARWTEIIVSQIGLSRYLVPKVYEQVDYNSFNGFIGYYGTKINAIIDATDDMTQSSSENGELSV